MFWLLPALTGLLLAASFPKAGQGYLAWIAFVPLILFLLRDRSPIRAFAGGFVAGAVQLFFLQIWIPRVLAQYGGLSGLLAWVAYGLMIILLSCFPAAACFVSELLIKRRGESFILLLPFIWVALEYTQNFLPFGGYPWLLTGYSQSGYLPLIQVADLTGVYGVSFLVLFFNVAVVWAGTHRRRRFYGTGPLAAAAFLIALSLSYGSFSLKRWNGTGRNFRVAMLQGNISFDEPESVMIDKFEEGYLRMADKLKSKMPDLLLIPESPCPVTFQYDPEYRRTVDRLAKHSSMCLIFNNIRRKNTGDGVHYFNSAYFLDHQGQMLDIYDKMHLVPFGEYIPLKNYFHFIDTISKDTGGFSEGRDYRVVKIANHPLNAVICFEIVFPKLVRRFVQRGSRLIVNLTNDAWYGDSAAPFQHLAIARWRAIENRRFLLRAANSGISAVIEPTGRIQSSTGLMREAVCEGRFAFIDQMTFYSRYGDVFVFVCVIIACGSLVLALMLKRIDPGRIS